MDKRFAFLTRDLSEFVTDRIKGNQHRHGDNTERPGEDVSVNVVAFVK